MDNRHIMGCQSMVNMKVHQYIQHRFNRLKCYYCNNQQENYHPDQCQTSCTHSGGIAQCSSNSCHNNEKEIKSCDYSRSDQRNKDFPESRTLKSSFL